MLEELFGSVRGVMIMLIIVVIAIIIMATVFGAFGIFEKKTLPQSVEIATPNVTCLGDEMRVSFSNVAINIPSENFKVMPVLSYFNAAVYDSIVSYDPKNAIELKSGNGAGAPSYTFGLAPNSPTVSLTLSFWKWSVLGCLNQTLSESPSYNSLVSECAADFITAQPVSAVTNGCVR